MFSFRPQHVMLGIFLLVSVVPISKVFSQSSAQTPNVAEEPFTKAPVVSTAHETSMNESHYDSRMVDELSIANDANTEASLSAIEQKLGAKPSPVTVSTAIPQGKLVLGGAVVADMFFNESRPVAPGAPFFLFPGNASGNSQRTFDANTRQTTFTLLALGPKLGCNWQPSAFVAATLFDASVIRDR